MGEAPALWAQVTSPGSGSSAECGTSSLPLFIFSALKSPVRRYGGHDGERAYELRSTDGLFRSSIDTDTLPMSIFAVGDGHQK